MFYHGGELPGFNSFMGYDPDNDVALVIWTNLTLSPDGRTTAQAMLADSSRRDLRGPVAGATADSDDDKVSGLKRRPQSTDMPSLLRITPRFSSEWWPVCS